jgi:competence protein ComEC
MVFISFSNSEKLRGGLIAILLGIFVAQFTSEMKYFLFFGGIFLMGAIILKNYFLTVLAIFLLFVFYGQWRYFIAFSDDQVLNFKNKTVSISGEVVSFLDEREKNNRVFLKLLSINKQAINGKILFIFPENLKIKYGDVLSFSGKIEKPKTFEDFDYAAYLKRFGATALVRQSYNVKILSHEGGILFLRLAASVREIFTKNLTKSLPIPHDRIATGVLLGVKNSLPKSISDDFKKSGLTHLLVVSGFNVSVVVFLVTMIFKKLGRKFVFFASIVAIGFFVAMTGGDAPVIRAALMGGIAGGAIAAGRLSDVRNVVLSSAVVIGIFAPAVIQRDIGFFLSFSATVGIVLFTKFFEKRLQFLPKKFEIRQIVAVLIAAQVSVFPILGFYFGKFPLIGFVANLFAEPLVPLSMAFSAIAIITGSGSVFMAKLFAIPAFIILEILINIAHFFGQVPPIPISKTVAIWMQIVVILAFFYGFFETAFTKK